MRQVGNERATEGSGSAPKSPITCSSLPSKHHSRSPLPAMPAALQESLRGGGGGGSADPGGCNRGRGLEPGKNFSTTGGACRTWKQMVRGTGPSLGVFQNWRVWAELVFAPEAVSAGSPRPPPAVMGEPGQRGTGKIKRGVRVCRPWSWPATPWRVKHSWEQLQGGRPHTDRAGGRGGSAGGSQAPSKSWPRLLPKHGLCRTVHPAELISSGGAGEGGRREEAGADP